MTTTTDRRILKENEHGASYKLRRYTPARKVKGILYPEITQSVEIWVCKNHDCVKIDDGFLFDLEKTKDAARDYVKDKLNNGFDWVTNSH